MAHGSALQTQWCRRQTLLARTIALYTANGSAPVLGSYFNTAGALTQEAPL